MVQWFGLSGLTALATGSIPGWGSEILQATSWPQGKTNKQTDSSAAILVIQDASIFLRSVKYRLNVVFYK